MAESKDYKKWLELAENEYAYAADDLGESDFRHYALTCFHFQQAAEKYFKAYLLFKRVPFRKIHNLVELVKECNKLDSSFLSLRKQAALLNPYYTETRYPIHWPLNITRNQAKKAQEAALIIGNFVKSKLK